jgi:hypothetical protein
MEVMLQRNCCERTAELHLNKWNWNYRKLVPEKYAECLDDWNKLTAFGRGHYIGLLEAEVVHMKDQKGLK